MDVIMLDCKQATFLASKKLDSKLNLIERIRLKIHLMNCNFCYTFNLQSEKIDKILKINPEELEHSCQNKAHLDEKRKRNIKEKLRQNADNQ